MPSFRVSLLGSHLVCFGPLNCPFRPTWNHICEKLQWRTKARAAWSANTEMMQNRKNTNTYIKCKGKRLKILKKNNTRITVRGNCYKFTKWNRGTADHEGDAKRKVSCMLMLASLWQKDSSLVIKKRHKWARADSRPQKWAKLSSKHPFHIFE